MSSTDLFPAELILVFLVVLLVFFLAQLVVVLLHGDSSRKQKQQNGADGQPTEAVAYPHLATIEKSVHAIYAHLSASRVRLYNESIQVTHLLADVQNDSSLAVQRLAKAIACFLNLQVGPIIVTFWDDLAVAGRVTLSSENHFFVDISSAHRDNPRDIAAILAHEATHVFLHRAGLMFSDLENEILTDTAAAYLGIGWLTFDFLCDLRRENRSANDTVDQKRRGYLTPEEFGYVLAKRSLVFRETPEAWFTSGEAKSTYRRALAVALQDFRIPPLADAPCRDRREYSERCRRARESLDDNHHREYPLYRFEKDRTLRVSFQCPVCFQRLRIPVGRRRLAVHCPVCEGKFDCLP
jgi:hypothetical protein